MAHISFTAGEALAKARVIQADGTYADDNTQRPAGVTFEAVASGEEVTVYAPGSSQVPCEAGGTIAAGDLVEAGTDGVITAVAGNAPGAGDLVLGYAETGASSGDVCYISFIPFIAGA